jgi:hypothetical protein
MSYWLKAIFCTFAPSVFLYFICLPYYDNHDDAVKDSQRLLFYACIYLNLLWMVGVNFLLGRKRNPRHFLSNAVIVIFSYLIFQFFFGNLYRSSFRWIGEWTDPVAPIQRVSIVCCLFLLTAVQWYLIVKEKDSKK